MVHYISTPWRDGKELKEPIDLLEGMTDGMCCMIHAREDYEQAMESVLFEGFEFDYEEFKGNPHYRNVKTSKSIYYHSY